MQLNHLRGVHVVSNVNIAFIFLSEKLQSKNIQGIGYMVHSSFSVKVKFKYL